MATVNKVILVGRLGADPETRYSASGQARCRLSLATNRRFTDAAGNKREETDWHRVTAWGKHGELCQTYLKKGRQVYVEGRLRRSAYTDKEGQKRYATEINANSVVFLDGPGRDGASADGASADVRLREPAFPSGPPPLPLEPSEESDGDEGPLPF